jgi:hypothetical protein
MNFVRRFFIIIFLLCMTTSCEEQPNVLANLASTGGDAAVYEEARKKVDDRQWDSAISMITVDLSAAYQTRADVKETLAGAYAGKCGLDFVNLATGLANSNSVAQLYRFFMVAMKNKIVVPSACDSAQAVIESFGNSAARTADQNLFLTIIGIAKSGAWIRVKADQDLAGLGDGAMDAGFDPCNATSFPDQNVIQATVGLGLVLNNVTTIASRLAGSTLNDINFFNANCLAAMQLIDPTVTTCDLTDVAFVTSKKALFRSLLNEGSTIGFGGCTTDTPFSACPCDGM